MQADQMWWREAAITLSMSAAPLQVLVPSTLLVLNKVAFAGAV
jgi:hypothetical protein